MGTETIGTVVLGFGPQPLDWMSKAAKICGKDAVMDPNVARMAGANLAAGLPAALEMLRQRLEAGALEVERQKYPSISGAAVVWLSQGERGLSSETMFQHLTGVRCLPDGWQSGFPWVPSDTADMRRCRLLLQQVPDLVPLFPKMAEASPKWAALVRDWDAICAAMDSGQSEEAYSLIKTAIGE